MDLRQLEMFLAVAEQGSFTRASQHLHVAQSAISRKIGMLEDELGEQLFKRVNKRVYGTPAAEALLRYVRRIFQDLRNASLEVSEIAQLKRGKVRVGAGMIACIYLLPPVLEKFKNLYPQVNLEVVSGSTENLVAQLRNNLIDLGVLTLPIEFPDLTAIPTWSEELVVVASTKHPVLSRKKSICVAELSNYPLILWFKEAYTRRLLDHFFREAGVTPHIAMEAESVATIKPLVKIDLGISIMPLRAVTEEAKRKELHYLRIRDHKLTRQLGLVFQKSDHLPKVLEILIRLFTESKALA